MGPRRESQRLAWVFSQRLVEHEPVQLELLDGSQELLVLDRLADVAVRPRSYLHISLLFPRRGEGDGRYCEQVVERLLLVPGDDHPVRHPAPLEREPHERHVVPVVLDQQDLLIDHVSTSTDGSVK